MAASQQAAVSPIGVDMCAVSGWFQGTHAEEAGQALVWPDSFNHFLSLQVVNQP
jgi:hypothetical protein